MSIKLLVGRRILVTRSAQQAGKLSNALREIGAEPVEVPVLEIQSPKSWDALDAALRRMSDYDWLIFTSANAVGAVRKRSAAIGVKIPVPQPFKVGAVGAATAAAAREAGFSVDFFPRSYVAEELVAGLPDQVADRKVLIARAEIARDVIPDALRAAGGQVDVFDAYRNLLPAAAPELLRAALASGIDAVTFTSSSSVAHLREAAERAGIAFPLDVPAISVGPVTSKTLREHGWPPAAEANPSDIPGLAAAVAACFAGSQG